jgi:hypothetical protein
LDEAVQAIVSKENVDMTQEAHIVVARDTRCIDILELILLVVSVHFCLDVCLLRLSLHVKFDV